MYLRSMRDSQGGVRRVLTLLGLLTALLCLAGCYPEPPVTPPPTTPTKVITESGIEYLVYSIKLPGTLQELKLRQGETFIWIPLSIIGYIRFTGPETDGYRPAEIMLSSGEKFRGELYSGQIIEGKTDIGDWNMPLKDVRAMSMGME